MKDNSRLLYHMRQSFAPGEISPIVANRIGYEMALEYTGGKHAFVVATHTDKNHIHNHVIFNAFNLEADGKFRDAYFNYRHVAEISDRLCKEYGLSVIEQKHGWRDPYNEWEEKKGINKADKLPTQREQLQSIIDLCINQKPKDFDHLLKMLKNYDCHAKRRGKNISISTPFSKSQIRLSSLPWQYSEDELRDRIEELRNAKASTTPHIYETDTHDTQEYISHSASNLYVDIFAEVPIQEDEYTSYEYNENENGISERQLAEMLENLPTGVTPEILQRALQNEMETLYEEDKSYYEDDAGYENETYYEYDDEPYPENAPYCENEIHSQAPSAPKTEFETIIEYPSNLKLIIDIQNSMKAQNSIGYKKWAEKFNLEQMSQTLIFIERHQLTYDELENMATRKPQTMQNIKSEIDALDDKLQHISLLQRHIGTLDKTKEIFKQYAQTNFNPEFRERNLKPITANEEAKKFMYDNQYTENFGRRIPPMQELKQSYAQITADKKKLWAKYHDIRNGDSGISNAWENVKAIMTTPNEIKIEPPVKKRNPYRSNAR